MVLFLENNLPLAGILEDNVHSNCLLVDGHVRIRCHSVLFSMISEMLSEILPHPSDDKEDSVIILPDRGEEVLKLVVNLVCSGEVKYKSSTNQKENIIEALQSLGVQKTLKLQDIDCEVLGHHVPELHVPLYDETVSSCGEEFSEPAEDGQPDFRIGPMYGDDNMLGLNSDSDEDKATNIDPSCDVIKPIFESSEDSSDSMEKINFQSDNSQQVFYNSSQQVTFQIPSAECSKCSKTCEAKCQSVFETWSQSQKLSLKSVFSADQSIDVKRKLLSHLGSQSAIGLSTDSYVLDSHSFCCNFLSCVTDISHYILKSVMNDFSRGKKIYEHASAGIAKVRPATSVFIAWMKEFAECYGQDAPDENVCILSYWLSKKVLFDMYLDETVGPHLSQASFYENFKTFFGANREDRCLKQIRISKYSSHSICNICTALNTNRRQAKNEAEHKIAKDKINHHKETFGQARKTIDEIVQSAITHPTDNLGKPYLYLCFKLICESLKQFKI